MNETLKIQNYKGLFMAVHVIQSYPSNNLNRGEDGSPKSCIFGGVRRSRVSSQCVKRNARMEFYKGVPENDADGMGIRTKAVPTMILGFLQGWADDKDSILWAETEADKMDAQEAAKAFDLRDISYALSTVGMQVDEKKGKTLKSVYYTTMKQCAAFAKAMIENGSKRAVESKDGKVKFSAYSEEEIAKFDDALNSAIALDILMFGRMNAGRTIHNVEATVQVAHEISTHRVEEEYDYFTAVDDMKERLNEAGSAHLDTAEFDSSTMYRYSAMDLGAMFRAMSLNGTETNIATVAREWVRAFVLSTPTGKKNSFATDTTPVYVFVSFHEDAPVSYVNAFEKPVTAGVDGYETASVKAFEDRVKRSNAIGWRTAPIAELGCSELPSELTECTWSTFPELLQNVEKTASDAVEALKKEFS